MHEPRPADCRADHDGCADQHQVLQDVLTLHRRREGELAERERRVQHERRHRPAHLYEHEAQGSAKVNTEDQREADRALDRGEEEERVRRRDEAPSEATDGRGRKSFGRTLARHELQRAEPEEHDPEAESQERDAVLRHPVQASRFEPEIETLHGVHACSSARRKTRPGGSPAGRAPVRRPISASTRAAAAPASVARARLVASADRRALASAGRLRRTRARLVLAARASTTGVRILGHDPHLLSEHWAHSADGDGPGALHASGERVRGSTGSASAKDVPPSMSRVAS